MILAYFETGENASAVGGLTNIKKAAREPPFLYGIGFLFKCYLDLTRHSFSSPALTILLHFLVSP